MRSKKSKLPIFKRLMATALALIAPVVVAGCNNPISTGFEIGLRIAEGDTALKRDDYKTAEKKYREAMDMSDQIKSRLLLAHALTKLAKVQERDNRSKEAEENYKKALEMFEEVKDDIPSFDKNYPRECVDAYAKLLRSQNKQDEARKIEERGKAISSAQKPK